MASEYLIEYVLKSGDVGYSEQFIVDVGINGRYIFQGNPDYDGRAVLAVDTKQARDAILRHPGARGALREPTDLISVQQKKNIRAVVLEVLEELGLGPVSEADDRPRRGRPRQKKDDLGDAS